MNPPATLKELHKQSEAVPRQPSNLPSIPIVRPVIRGFGVRWLQPALVQKSEVMTAAVLPQAQREPTFQNLDEYMGAQHELSEQLFEAMAKVPENLGPEHLTSLLRDHIEYSYTQQVTPRERAAYNAYMKIPIAPTNTAHHTHRSVHQVDAIRNPVPAPPQRTPQIMPVRTPHLSTVGISGFGFEDPETPSPNISESTTIRSW
jgi:hypothetical protein